MRYFSMFTGIGGFEKGIEQSYEKFSSLGGEISWNEGVGNLSGPRIGGNLEGGRVESQRSICIGYSEIDKYAIQIYSKHYPEHKNYGSATTIDPATLPDFDLLVGGFPCQAFSIAGKRRGFEDTRGTLFFDIAKILREKRPRHFILENVKGLLSHDFGNTFKTIISTLAELGYSVEWQVLNSKNFGVPQNRERVFIIGHLGGFGGRQVFPITGDDGIHPKQSAGAEPATQHTFSTIATNPKRKESNYIKQLVGGSQGNRVYDPSGISSTLASQAGGLGAKTGLYAILNKAGDIKPKTIASTLTGGGHSGGNHSDMDLLAIDYKIRRLTPKECERLQGFPDDWTAGVSDTQRYKCCGNAVTVNVVEQIIKRLFLR